MDLAVETARREAEAEAQVPLKIAEQTVFSAAEWMRISFMVFLSSEGQALMGIHNFGEWKCYAIERFRGILHLTVRNADKLVQQFRTGKRKGSREAWNVSE